MAGSSGSVWRKIGIFQLENSRANNKINFARNEFRKLKQIKERQDKYQNKRKSLNRVEGCGNAELNFQSATSILILT
jgi:hypothetical protein